MKNNEVYFDASVRNLTTQKYFQRLSAMTIHYESHVAFVFFLRGSFKGIIQGYQNLLKKSLRKFYSKSFISENDIISLFLFLYAELLHLIISNSYLLSKKDNKTALSCGYKTFNMIFCIRTTYCASYAGNSCYISFNALHI